jgi:hypothetical protein
VDTAGVDCIEITRLRGVECPGSCGSDVFKCESFAQGRKCEGCSCAACQCSGRRGLWATFGGESARLAQWVLLCIATTASEEIA